jgi:hypothetical protein
MDSDTAFWLLSTIIQASAMMIALTVTGGVFYYERMVKRLSANINNRQSIGLFKIDLVLFGSGIILLILMVVLGATLITDASHLLSDVPGGIQNLSAEIESSVNDTETSFVSLVWLTALVLVVWFLSLFYGMISWGTDLLKRFGRILRRE